MDDAKTAARQLPPKQPALQATVPLMYSVWIGNDLDSAAACPKVSGNLGAAVRANQLILSAIQHQQRRACGATVLETGDARRVERYMSGEPGPLW